jgi:predicted RNA binding protein with dsRBD fold (UPF0201 family)
MEQINLQVEVEINPTESEEKVQKSIYNLLGNIETQTKTLTNIKKIIARATGTEQLNIFRNLLKRDHIRDAARKALLHGRKGDKLTIYINKQVAYGGHVSFSEAEGESPLGPIKFCIESSDLTKLIDWIAPKTGRIRA